MTLGFHGTSREIADKIMASGFKAQFNRQGLYGEGIYTSGGVPVAVAHASKFPNPRCMFICRVLTGRYGATKSGARGPEEVFDSGGNGSPNINLAFNNYFVYPEYLVEFNSHRV